MIDQDQLWFGLMIAWVAVWLWNRYRTGTLKLRYLKLWGDDVPEKLKKDNLLGIGMLAVLGICVVPFLNLGAHYLMYKCTAALAATASGDGRVTGLIEALGTAFGLILAMTASCAVLLVVAMVSAVSAVTG